MAFMIPMVTISQSHERAGVENLLVGAWWFARFAGGEGMTSAGPVVWGSLPQLPNEKHPSGLKLSWAHSHFANLT
ncbi:hypothetical protein Dda_8734 [Drechslerella dactyloides]|uniref:Uncharacterized protein n=1 Tax=Drechslerella dactyloides TaxID=74499 RepID=A0AAD6IS04_DREDA|nr:hypothetical protein Dda_8734 [Drechslerella dactyloides]